MTEDLERRARRAGAALRTAADDRARQLPVPTPCSRTRRRTLRWGPLGAAGTVLASLVAAVMFVPRADVLAPEVGPVIPDPADRQPSDPVADVDGWLEIPEVGDATPAYLADGSPVFVSRPVDDEVIVLDARSPYGGPFVEPMVGYCRSNGWFEDGWSGSRFTGWGDWTTGPAAAGMGAYPSEIDLSGQRVRVTGRAEERPARLERRGQDQPQAGPSCAPPDETDNPDEHLLAHRAPSDPPPLDGVDIPRDRWVWAAITVGGPGQTPRACTVEGPCDENAPLTTGFGSSTGGFVAVEPRETYLARRHDDGRVQLLVSAHRGTELYRDVAATHSLSLIQLPSPGGATPAVAGPLPDGDTGHDGPVFVVRDLEGGTIVVEASAAHDPAHLLSWCPTDRTLRGAGTVYAADGTLIAGEGAAQLRQVDHAIVEAAGQQAVRLVGEVSAEEPPVVRRRGLPPACEDTLRTHEPGVIAPVDRLSPWMGRGWRWTSLPSVTVDGQLYICNLGTDIDACEDRGPYPDGCGGPGSDDEPCIEASDPEVITPNVRAALGPEHPYLVKSLGDQVEVRVAATAADLAGGQGIEP